MVWRVSAGAQGPQLSQRRERCRHGTADRIVVDGPASTSVRARPSRRRRSAGASVCGRAAHRYSRFVSADNPSGSSPPIALWFKDLRRVTRARRAQPGAAVAAVCAHHNQRAHGGERRGDFAAEAALGEVPAPHAPCTPQPAQHFCSARAGGAQELEPLQRRQPGWHSPAEMLRAQLQLDEVAQCR
jgi:hypothetical protein